MKIEKLTVSYFKVFRKKQTFHFPLAPSLNFMFGENQVDKDMGSNASGKSSVWDALCWVFYGKTARNIKASGVGNWEFNKPCTVTVEYVDVSGCRRVLTRTWRPVGLFFSETGENVNVTTEQVVGTIRMPYEAFLGIVLLPQFGTSFLSQKPAQRERYFSELLELDIWLELSKRAGVKAGIEEVARKEYENALYNIVGKIESLKAINYRKDISEWEGKVRQDMDDLAEEIESATVSLGKAYRDKLAITNRLEYLSESIEEKSEEVYQLRGRLQELEALHDELISLVAVCERERERVFVLYNDIYELKEGKCSLCGQSVSKKYYSAERKRLEDNLYERDMELEESIKKRDSCKKKLAELRQLKRELQIHIAEDREESLRITYRLEDLARMFNKAVLDVQDFQEELDVLCEASNPYKSKQADIDRKVERLEHKQRCSIVKIQERVERAEAYRYWVVGFREVRLYLLSESMRQLEFEINEAMVQLGLIGWRISIGADRINNKGDLTGGKGFEVYVSSPTSPKKVLWESWSGGESQRLMVASLMGASSLLKNKYGVFPSLEVWDEYTNYMSEEGVSDFLELMRDRSTNLGSQVWLVDHSRIQYSGFDNEVVVRRTPDAGSLIEVKK